MLLKGATGCLSSARLLSWPNACDTAPIVSASTTGPSFVQAHGKMGRVAALQIFASGAVPTTNATTNAATQST